MPLYWSRLAIAQSAADGLTYVQLREMFGVGRSTVYRAIKGKPRGYANQCHRVHSVGLIESEKYG
ncbi:MAG: helix-turn-helix domain-containing protein [Novosphingobium sp.]